jgi:hypothetical protein
VKPKAGTLSEKFGFQDHELSTAKHDEIMLWLDANAERLFGKSEWEPERVAAIRKMASAAIRENRFGKSGIGPPVEALASEPPRVIAKVERKWEKPIVAANGFMIGFIDMEITVYIPRLSWSCVCGGIIPEECSWTIGDFPVSPQERHMVEVKPEIRSLGEVIRQIRMYEAHCAGKYYICCPDERFKSALASQGIGFIKPEV